MENTPPSAQTERDKDSSGYPWVNDLKKLLMMDQYDPTEIIKYTGGFRALVGFIRSLEIQTKYAERTRLLSVESMKHSTHKMTMKMHDDGGTSPCLHCSCGSTWGATERAMSHLINEHNERQSILSEMEKGSV